MKILSTVLTITIIYNMWNLWSSKNYKWDNIQYTLYKEIVYRNKFNYSKNN